jgi:site-specific DNA-methyltransferase (cytosine-N4-specific)
MEMPTEGNPVSVLEGDNLELLPTLPAGAFDCCVTSPPYWGGVRDYGVDGAIGDEPDPAAYVDALSAVFLGVHRVTKPEGALWLNVGDIYAAGGRGGGQRIGGTGGRGTVQDRPGFRMPPDGYKMKDLTLTPFLVADRLRRDGWTLRQTVIWSKPVSPEPMRLDRPSVSHEYVFLFTAQRRPNAVRNPGESWWGSSVWDIPSDSSSDHPATMPRELARRCVVSSSVPGGLVLDPFGGSGTTGLAALRADRRAVLLELNPEYAALARRRCRDAMGTGLLAL